MHRRGTVPIGTFLIAIVIAALTVTFGASLPVAATAPEDVPPPTVIDTDDPGVPRPTVSDFFPENNNLSDCIGLVERPGCGSESRGGLGQALVFLALAIGLGVIFWRVSRGVRANRSVTDTADSSDSSPPPDHRVSRTD
ncbi:MAG: hypothetical protein AB8G14_16920 [Ilumatobacter sp.]